MAHEPSTEQPTARRRRRRARLGLVAATALVAGTFLVVGGTSSPASAHLCSFAHWDHYHAGIQGHWTHVHWSDYQYHYTLGATHYNVFAVSNHGTLHFDCGGGNVGH
jgi:hypothetical protein